MSWFTKFWINLFSIPMMILIYFGVIIFIFTVSMGSSVTITQLLEEDLYDFLGYTIFIALLLFLLFFIIMSIFVKNAYVQTTFLGFVVGLFTNIGRIYLLPMNELLFYGLTVFGILFFAVVARKKFSLEYFYASAFTFLLFFLYLK